MSLNKGSEEAKEVFIDGERWAEADAAGFDLYVPPSPMLNENLKQPHVGRFVMLDDINDMFYNVDYDAAKAPSKLKNHQSWAELALHTIKDPALVLPGDQWTWLNHERTNLAKGFLVSVRSRQDGIIMGTTMGSIFIRRIPQEYMNWPALRRLKGDQLAAEVKAGLLRRLWDKRDNVDVACIPYVTPAEILEKMESDWFRNGESLSWQLDHQFVGGKFIDRHQKWRLQFGHGDEAKGISNLDDVRCS